MGECLLALSLRAPDSRDLQSVCVTFVGTDFCTYHLLAAVCSEPIYEHE